MVAELGLHRSVYLADRLGEDDAVEFRNHLTLGEFAQVAALLAGGTL